MAYTKVITQTNWITMSNDNFRDWLWKELDQRGMSQSDITRQSKIKISPGAISHVLNGTRDPGPEFCKAIASAFNYSPEYVFRKAGILPKEKNKTPTLEEANELMEQLPEEYQQQALALIRFLHESHAPYDTQESESQA